jgi:hypothetical protein
VEVAMRRTVRVSMFAAVVGALVIAGCSNDSAPERSSPTPTQAASADPVDIAREFIDAYGDADADRALTYLTEEAFADHWQDEDTFRMELAFHRATGSKQMVRGCKEQDDSADSTTVRCAFAYHDFYSDEIGRGPFTDSYWDVVVRDGKVTSAVVNGNVFTNGFSNEMWTPFQVWVTSTHPEDVPVMYMGGGWAITEESIPLWEQRLREWVEWVKASE